jgi:hypothetical protein
MRDESEFKAAFNPTSLPERILNLSVFNEGNPVLTHKQMDMAGDQTLQPS